MRVRSDFEISCDSGNSYQSCAIEQGRAKFFLTILKNYDILIIEREVITMRNLYYLLADGTTTKSYKEAKASGQSYKVMLEREAMAKPVLSEKRKAMLVKLS